MLAVGRELLIGRTINTNAHWVGKRLAILGTQLARISTVDDDLDEISGSLGEALSRRPDFLVVVGGLGPTPDDMTVKGVARGLGKDLAVSRQALELIREHYVKVGRKDFRLTPARRKMAVLPEGAAPLENEKGTAPGVRIETGATVIFCLPGVPSEMRSIFSRSVLPEIRGRIGKLFRVAARLKIEGIYESALAPVIARELTRHPGAYIKSHPKGVKGGISRIELDVVVVNGDQEAARKGASGIVNTVTADILRGGGRIVSQTGVRADAG